MDAVSPVRSLVYVAIALMLYDALVRYAEATLTSDTEHNVAIVSDGSTDAG